MIKTGRAKNESDLARKTGISRVRICQYIRLLSLRASVIRAVEQLGDPLTKQIITERRLRAYWTKTSQKQGKILKIIASRKM